VEGVEGVAADDGASIDADVHHADGSLHAFDTVTGETNGG